MNHMPTENSAASAAAPPSRPLRILYADDMPELRSLMRDMLARQGHSVETVDGGDTALLRLKETLNGYDLLITDHHMPGINGLELVRQARELTYPCKIVVFSSEISDEVHEQYRRFAVDAILPKPIFPAIFRSALDELFAVPPVKAAPAQHARVKPDPADIVRGAAQHADAEHTTAHV